MRRLCLSMFVCGIVQVSMAPSAHAQLNTQHIKGTVGLKAGSQAPPNVYVIAPLLYLYNTDEVRNSEGDRLPGDVSVTSFAGGGGFNVVTSKKILGGNYGFQMLFPVAIDNRLQGAAIEGGTGGLTDSAIVPVSLGWHFERADLLAGYAIYLPTGQFSPGGTSNTGYGMWGHEPSIGTTVYLNESKQLHAGTVASVTFNTTKRNTGTTVGTAMNLEGGVGGDFLGGALTAGLVYYTEWKLSEDEIDAFPEIVVRGKNKVFALGPEVSMPLAWKGMVRGFVKVNYQWELYARTTTKGSELTILTTFLMNPLKLPTP